MGYQVLGKTEDLLKGFEPRKGLEGPYNLGGRVLYYDRSVGQYYDPTTDFYVEHYEMETIHARMVGALGWKG